MPTFKEVIRRIELEVRDLLINRPDLSYKVAANLFDVSEDTILKIAKQFGIHRKVGRKSKSISKAS